MKIQALLIALLFGLKAYGQEVTNPVWTDNWPDPTIWQDADGYHCLATNVQRILQSTDLFHWTLSEQRPIDEASWQTIRGIANHFWAPDVAYVDGRWLLYLSLYNSADDSQIAVLRQEDDGKFHFVRVLTRSSETRIRDTIDPEVVVRGGHVWLFFGSVGRIHRIELTSDGLNLKPGSEYVHVAGRTNREDPSRSTVFEGSYLHKHGRYWYLFVSSGNYADHTYQLQVGRSRKLTGTFRNREGKPMREGYATPVISSQQGDHFFGPGHCGEIFTAPDGQEYIFYHCHNTDTRPNSRPMMMQRILWDRQGWPYVEGGKPSETVR